MHDHPHGDQEPAMPDALVSTSINFSPVTGCEPTDAHQAMVALVTSTLLEVADRRQDELPGFVETLQDDVLVTTGGTTRRVYGWFAEGAWRYGDRQVHEIFLNADRRDGHPRMSAAEDLLTTLLHEGCHVWAKVNGISDTSRDGRYHNRRFAQIALVIGLDVEKDAVIGHRTPGLSARGRADYTDLLSNLDQGLVLAREPKPTEDDNTATADDQQTALTSSAGPQTHASKYVFASCWCQDGRRRKMTIRVAKGTWRPGVIRCDACQTPFRES
jgi:hypothetical protein